MHIYIYWEAFVCVIYIAFLCESCRLNIPLSYYYVHYYVRQRDVSKQVKGPTEPRSGWLDAWP